MLSMPDSRGQSGFFDSQQRQQSPFRNNDGNIFASKPQQDSKLPSSSVMNGFGGSSMWSSGAFGQKLAAKQLDAAHNKALNLRAESQTFEPRSGSASLIGSSEAEIPWSRRGSAWNIDLKSAAAQPGSTLASPSPLGFGQIAPQPVQNSYSTAVKQSLVVGSRTQSLARLDQANGYSPPTASASSAFSSFKGFLDESKSQAYESNDFPWANTRSTNSPIQESRDVFAHSSASTSRKNSLPTSRHGYESLLASSQDPFARRSSRPDIHSSTSTFRLSRMNSTVREESHSNSTRPQLPSFNSQQTTSTFRRPSSHSSSLWSADAFSSRDLFGKRSSNIGYATTPSNCSPTNDMSFAQQDALLNGNSYSHDAYEKHNTFTNNAPMASQTLAMNSSISDPWQIPATPFMPMANNRLGTAPTAAEQFQQQMYLNMQYQMMAGQARAGQFVPQMGPFGYYPPPVSHNVPTQSFYPQMTAPAPAPIYPNVQKPVQSHTKNVQSSKLHEFHANNSRGRRYELKDIFGHVVEFSGDQQGSRFLQTKLETANSDEKSTLFAEIMPNARQLMQDIYGNYVVQKLFEHGDQTQKKMLANTLKGHIPALSMQPYGCRVVQKAFDHILTDQQAELVSELNADNRVTKCLRDQHGNHVIQKAIEVIPSPYIQFIYEAMQGQILQYSVHTFGCRVVQRMLEKQDEVLKQSVLQELSQCTPDLVMDSFGNYVAQHVIKHGDDVNRNRMITLVLSNVKTFARHKFASNVVEKCILHGTLEQQLQILNHVLDPMGDGLAEYVKCAYGNYVIQSLLENLPKHQGQQLYHELIPEVHKAKRTTPKKTIEGIEEKMARFDTPHSSRPSSMHSVGVASTPISITSSITSVGNDLSDILNKSQTTTYNPVSTSPIEQNFANLSVNHMVST